MSKRLLQALILLVLTVATVLLAIHQARPVSSGSEKVEQATTQTSSTPASIVSNSSFYIVMLAVRTCPHCRAMEEFFKRLPVASYYCEIRGSDNCTEAFWELYNREVTRGTPTIIVCTSDGLVLVEVGEYQNESWWLTVPSSLKPVREGSIPVYMGGSIVQTLNVTSSLYDKLCVKTLSASYPIKS